MFPANRFRFSSAYSARCAAALDTAFSAVPFYAAWRPLDPGGPSLDARYDALPALTKADMRASFPDGLLPRGKDLQQGLRDEEVEYTFTSGTTAEKVVNIWDQNWWSRSEAASWQFSAHLAALPYPQKQAKLASSLNVGISCEEDLPTDHRILGNTLYLNEKTSVLQWQPRHLRRMADELDRYAPVLLEANPSLLARLACYIIDNDLSVRSPQVIVFTFEFPSAIHLRLIRRAFPGSAFVSSYGSTETGFVLEQCEDGLLHQNTEFCRIDFQPLKARFGGPELGRIYVTTFGNPWNCIVRFDVGDLVRLHGSGRCTCGRSEGLIADAVEGRIGNVTFAADGGLVTTKTLDDRLAEVSALRDYHLEQTAPHACRLETMLEPGADIGRAEAELREALADVYGAGEFDVRVLDNILPGPAGKFRRTQANFAFDEKELFL